MLDGLRRITRARLPDTGGRRKCPRKGRRPRSGQAVVFLVMALVILVFAGLWSVDIHRILFVKDRSQNAGDAAALAAARWQASSLNLLGELNLMHALALAVGDSATVDLVTNTQLRLCFSGPMAGMAAAQQAAKLNGIPVNDEFTAFVAEHADTVRNEYTRLIGGEMMFPEPYPGAWDEYATMLDTIAADGVAAGADNAILFSDAIGGHTLLDRAFYDAIAGRNWCWFYLNAPGLLEEYTGYTWWPGLPIVEFVQHQNSEFFSLAVGTAEVPLARFLSAAQVDAAAVETGLTPVADPDRHWQRDAEVWFAYPSGRWGSWDAMALPFPVTGTVRPEYDYLGADAVSRVQASIDRMTPGAGGDGAKRDSVTWTAAAKPFGYLDLEGRTELPTRYGLVLPAFREVRLFPVDAASLPGGGSFDLEWRRHVVEHLPVYMERGPSALDSSCWYCSQLVTWEDAAFRRSGVDWLRLHSDQCTVSPPGGGGGNGGGSRRAH